MQSLESFTGLTIRSWRWVPKEKLEQRPRWQRRLSWLWRPWRKPIVTMPLYRIHGNLYVHPENMEVFLRNLKAVAKPGLPSVPQEPRRGPTCSDSF